MLRSSGKVSPYKGGWCRGLMKLPLLKKAMAISGGLTETWLKSEALMHLKFVKHVMVRLSFGKLSRTFIVLFLFVLTI